MAKKVRRTRRSRRDQERSTDWRVVGGVIALALIALITLLVVSLTAEDSVTPTPAIAGIPLDEYCQENPDSCISKGSSEAPITIIEISDYGCGHCRDFNLETAGLIEDLYVTPGDVQWIVFPFALRQETLPAAAAAMCADEQEGFFEFHKRLFEIQGESGALMTRGFKSAAEDVGLDADAFDACLDSGRYRRIVADNMTAAGLIGVRATPTFFIEGQMIEGNIPFTGFQQQIERLLGS